jgi:hypothetical protein
VFKSVSNNDGTIDWIISQGTPQEISMTLYSYAVCGIQCPLLCKAVENHWEFIVTEGNSVNIANTAYAFGKLRYRSTVLFNHIDNLTASFVTKTGSTTHLATIMWSFGKLGLQAPNFVRCIEKNAKFVVERCNGRDLAMILHAFCTYADAAGGNAAWGTEERAPTLFRLIHENAAFFMANAAAKDAASIFFSFAKLGYHAPKIAGFMDERSKDLVERLDGRELAEIAMAYSIMNIHPKQFFNVIEKAVPLVGRKSAKWSLSDGNGSGKGSGGVTANNMVELLWCVSMLDRVGEYETLFEVLWERIFVAEETNAACSSGLSNRSLRMVEDIEMVAKYGDIGVDLAPVPSAVRRRMDNLAAGQLGEGGGGGGGCVESATDGSLASFKNEYRSLIEALGRDGLKLEKNFKFYSSVTVSDPSMKAMRSKKRRKEKTRREEEEGKEAQGQSRGSGVVIDLGLRRKRICVQFEDVDSRLTGLGGNGSGSGSVSDGGGKTNVVTPNGLTQARLRMLENLGWNVIVISHYDAMRKPWYKKGGDVEERGKEDWIRMAFKAAGVLL